MTTALIFCGSRDWKDPGPIRERLAVWNVGEGEIVIHGACRGADEIAGRLARSMGFQTIECPANWDFDGKAAGPRRNAFMVRLALTLVRRPSDVRCYAFTEDIIESRGTADMVRRCKAAQIPTFVYDPSEVA